MIYVIADSHSDRERILELEHRAMEKYGTSPGEGDVLLVCGDLIGKYNQRVLKQLKGVARRVVRRRNGTSDHVTKLLDYPENALFVEWLKTRPYTVLSIHGNHDSTAALGDAGERVELYGGEAVKLTENLFYLDNGETYHIPDGNETVSVLALGEASGHLARLGADIGNYTVDTYLAEAGIPSEPSYDVVISHDGPASKIGAFRWLYGINPVNEALDEIEREISYGAWYYGHHHSDRNTSKNFRCLYRDIIKL